MEGSIKDLVSIRFDRAKEMLGASQVNFEQGELKTSLSDIIKKASYCREKSDYDDFYIVSKEETEEQLKNAKIFLDNVDKYIKDNV